MRILRAAVLIGVFAALSGPARAQSPNINLLPELQSKTPEEKEADAIREKAYRESLKRIPDARGSSDPWGAVRSAEPVRPAAPKPRTKTGSSAN